MPEKKAVLFQFEIVFVKTSKQFQIKIVFCKIRSQFSMNTIPISHFFSARFARKQFKLEIIKSLSKKQFSFRDPILGSFVAHFPLEIHILRIQNIKIFALRALFIL